MSGIADSDAALDARGMRLAIVRAVFNRPVTDGLLAGARRVLERAGAEDVLVVDVPGAFELPVVADALARRGFDGVVALGAVVAGETDHYEHIARETSRGLQEVAVRTGVPVGFGVLTVRRAEHAFARSAPGGDNKGAEAAAAVVRTVSVLRSLEGRP